jgi:hypothetical protein
MNSPEASPTPAPTMPGPMILQIDAGGSGISRTSTRLLVLPWLPQTALHPHPAKRT